MKQETKNEIKKNVATGASTAAGAVAGVFIGAAATPITANAQEEPTPEPVPQPKPTPQPKPDPQPKPEPQPEPAQPDPVTPEPPAPVPPTPNPDPEPEVEVISYDRVTNEDGTQMDIAVLNVSGHEVAVIDANLDGEADALVCDLNQNGVIEDGEIEVVQGQGMAMQPFADAAGFNPLYAQNDLPDYVNNADVDTYMA